MTYQAPKVDPEREALQVELWIREAEHLLSRSTLRKTLELCKRSWNDAAGRENLITVSRGVAHLKWIESFKTGALQNPPGSWAGGVLKDFVSYEYAPLFFRNVSEPRLRTKPADILWIIETTEKYQLASLEYAFAKILRLYLDILLTAEEVAGQITYHSYGLTNVNDDKYWEAREKAFEAVGLNLSGEEFLKKAIPRIEDLVKELMSE